MDKKHSDECRYVGHVKPAVMMIFGIGIVAFELDPSAVERAQT